MQSLFPILHEDAELLVINKPADLVCHPTKGDATSSLIGRIRLYLGPEAVPQMINRLDRETSGVILVAKRAESARALRMQWEKGEVGKRYLAVVHGHVTEASGRIEAPLGRDERSAVAIKDRVRPDGAPAATEFIRTGLYWRQGEPFSVLDVRPLTGRKHQIRIHLAYSGHPIVGDKLYGHDEQCYLDLVAGRLAESQKLRLLLANHALHAASLSFIWRGERKRFEAVAEASLMGFIGELCAHRCANR